MRSFALLAVALLGAGCEYHEPGMSSADIQAFAVDHPRITPTCVDDLRWGRRRWYSVIDNPECLEMQPARHWSGLWEHGWEWTNFCADPANECDWMAKSGTWLIFAANAYPKVDLPDGIHRIEFIGRRTNVPGQFGHQGSYEYLIVVDRAISIRARPGEKYEKRF